MRLHTNLCTIYTYLHSLHTFAQVCKYVCMYVCRYTPRCIGYALDNTCIVLLCKASLLSLNLNNRKNLPDTRPGKARA